jgi:O-antigen/teichoic acid export membrane protein
MSSRFITGTLCAILGGFMVVASQAFIPGVLSWVAVAIAIGVIVIVAVSQFDPSRGAVQRVLDAFSVIVGGLLVGFGLAASGAAVTWLVFAFALGLVATAVVGLCLNEVANWRSQHQLAELHWLHTEALPIEHPAQAA